MTARSAATAAGKRATRDSKRAKASDPVPTRPGGVRRSLAPANPRRVSGPVHGRSGAPGARALPGARPAGAATARAAAGARAAVAAGATAMAVAAEVAPRIVRPLPRITRPLRETPPPAPRPLRETPRPAPRITRRRPAHATRGARALAFVRRLPDHSLTDRLVRGRAWIPLLGVLLVGIVALQVSILRLNASMGRAIEQGTTLQTRNGQLRAQVASLGAVSRIERIGSAMGMVMSTPSQISFLAPGSGRVRAKAIANMTAPTATALGTVQAATSGAAAGTTAASTVVPTSTTSTISTAAAGPGANPSGVSTSPTQSSAGAQSTPAASTNPTAGSAAPTGVGGAPTGAAGTQPLAGVVTGAAGSGQQAPASGGASSTAAGG